LEEEKVKRIIALAAIAAASLGTGLVSADPGPNGHNNWGLCNAYAHNNQNGKDHGQPFGALEQAAEDADQTVAEWCAENGVRPGNGG
jgi:hypothetical protein